jgi:hypothetical protein
MRKSLVLTIAVLAVVLSGCGKKQEGFEGTYKVEGFKYSAELTVTKAGAGYRLEWKMSDGSVQYGLGIERDSVLAVVQASNPPKIMAYRKQGKHLTGSWAEPDMEGIKFERAKDAKRLRRSKHDLSGTYHLDGTTPSGDAYQGTLTLTRTHLTHVARWEIEGEEGKDPYFGIGFTVDSLAILGYGSVEEVGVGIYKIDGQELSGVTVTADPAALSSPAPSSLAPIATGTERAVLVPATE